MPVVYFRGTREELRALIAMIPAAAAGRIPDEFGIAQAVQGRGGLALLSKIQQAFIVKSRGGTDECGIKWPPLKPQTIAQRRTTAGERKALGITGRRVRGLLTVAQDQQWRAIYRRILERDGDRAKAARMAWAILKSQGAKTKLALLGGRPVDILRDTGLMLASLSPGVDAQPSAPYQVFKTEPGAVTVGTNRYPWHQTGIHGKLPKRELWPSDGNLPETWWNAITGAMTRGVVQVLILVLGGGRIARP